MGGTLVRPIWALPGCILNSIQVLELNSEKSNLMTNLLHISKSKSHLRFVTDEIEAIGPLIIATGILITVCGVVWVPVTRARIKKEATYIKCGIHTYNYLERRNQRWIQAVTCRY